jgi:GTPase SAR1 family protein
MNNLQTLSLTSLPKPFASSDLIIKGAKHGTDIIILRKKIIVCGDAMTGKTTMIQTLLEGQQAVHGDYHMTQGLELNVVTVPVERVSEDYNDVKENRKQRQEVDLFVYDMPGEQFQSESLFLSRRSETNEKTNLSIGQVMTKWCTCIIYVFDVSCRKSLQNVIRWIELLDLELKLDNDGRHVSMILVGNKVDLRNVSF